MTSLIRRKKQQIILAVGLPGSGKSTYFRKRGIQPLSSDTMRRWLLDDETDQSQQHHVFAALRYLLELRLRLGRKTNYVDATNLTRQDRRHYFQMAKHHDCELRAIFFDVPLATCQRRNRRRQRRVPDEVMERMARQLAPPTRAEGFTRITIVRK
ncbi:MAG: AAA family ATPase [Acidobacteria bacterium]|nr:AAA family ATPase [Acidobacteriota bacterium]